MILGNGHISREKQNFKKWLELNTEYLRLDKRNRYFLQGQTEKYKRQINYKWHEYTWDPVALKGTDGESGSRLVLKKNS